MGALKCFGDTDPNRISTTPEAYFIGILKNYQPEEFSPDEHEIKKQLTQKSLKDLEKAIDEVEKEKQDQDYQEKAGAFFKLGKRKDAKKQPPEDQELPAFKPP
jgi:chaperonin cofactor prefoldin